MTYRRRRLRLSAVERAELWARWKQGERLSDITTALGRAPGTVYARIRKAGGISERPLSVPIEDCTEAPIEIAHLGSFLSA